MNVRIRRSPSGGYSPLNRVRWNSAMLSISLISRSDGKGHSRPPSPPL